MAQLIKDKKKRQQEMMNSSAMSTTSKFAKNTQEAEDWNVLKEKARLMAVVLDKKAYQGGVLYAKEQHAKKIELEKKLLKKH